MAGTNQYPPFGTAAGALTLAYQAWLAYAARQQGFQIGEVDPEPFNTVLRLSSVPASALAQIICDYANVDAVDDGSVPNFEASLRTALAAMLAGAYVGLDNSSSTNVITAALSPVPPALNQTFPFYIRANNTNTAGVVLTLNGLTQKNLVRRDGSTLQANDIVSGRFYHVIYDSNLGAYRLLSGVPSDTTSVSPTTINTIINNAPVNAFVAPSATNTIPSAASATQVTNFGTVVNNLGSIATWNASSSRLTINTAGWFNISIVLDTNLPVGGSGGYGFSYSVGKNGGATSSIVGNNGISNSAAVFGPFGSASSLYYLNSGDYLQVYAAHNYGSSLNMPIRFAVEAKGQ